MRQQCAPGGDYHDIFRRHRQPDDRVHRFSFLDILSLGDPGLKRGDPGAGGLKLVLERFDPEDRLVVVGLEAFVLVRDIWMLVSFVKKSIYQPQNAPCLDGILLQEGTECFETIIFEIGVPVGPVHYRTPISSRLVKKLLQVLCDLQHFDTPARVIVWLDEGVLVEQPRCRNDRLVFSRSVRQ